MRRKLGNYSKKLLCSPDLRLPFPGWTSDELAAQENCEDDTGRHWGEWGSCF